MAEHDDFDIRVRITVDQAIPGLQGVTRGFEGLQKLASGIGTSLRNSIMSGLSLLGGGALAGVAARGLISIHTEAQNAEMGIASLVSAMGGLGMDDALLHAREQLQGLREDAAKGAGDLHHYANAYQLILAPALGAGATLEGVRELTRQTLQAGFAMRGQEGLHLAPMDVVQALTGGVSDRATPIVTALLRTMDMSPEEFNTLGTAQRMEALQKAFSSMDEAADAMGRTWDANMATLRDNVRSLIMDLTRPLFDVWSEQLARANEWLERNRDTLRDMAENLGPKLAAAWEGLTEHAGSLATTGAMGAVGAVGLRGMMAGMGGGALTGAGLATMGVVLAPLIFAVGSLKGAIGESPQLLTDLGSALGRLGRSLMLLSDAVASLFREGSPLNRAGRRIMQAATHIANGLAIFVGAIAVTTRLISDQFVIWKELAQGVWAFLNLDPGKANEHFDAALELQKASQERAKENFLGLLNEIKVKRKEMEEEDGKDGPPVNKNPPVNINGPVNIRIEAKQLDDPNRVAGAFTQIIMKLRAAPLEAQAQRLLPKPT